MKEITAENAKEMLEVSHTAAMAYALVSIAASLEKIAACEECKWNGVNA